MIKYTAGFVDKLENILSESGYKVRYERGNFQSGWCLLDHKSVVVLNKFLNVEGRVNTLVDLIPQLKIDFDKLTFASQKIYDFLSVNHLKEAKENAGAVTEAGDEQSAHMAEDELISADPHSAGEDTTTASKPKSDFESDSNTAQGEKEEEEGKEVNDGHKGDENAGSDTGTGTDTDKDKVADTDED